ALPRYIARIREGNNESHEFLMDEGARAEFNRNQGLDADVDDEEKEAGAPTASATAALGLSGKSGAITRRITLHEIFESTEMTKLLQAIRAAGLEINRFSPTEDARYVVTENAGQK